LSAFVLFPALLPQAAEMTMAVTSATKRPDRRITPRQAPVRMTFSLGAVTRHSRRRRGLFPT
jgi:hypothetical protein